MSSLGIDSGSYLNHYATPVPVFICLVIFTINSDYFPKLFIAEADCALCERATEFLYVILLIPTFRRTVLNYACVNDFMNFFFFLWRCNPVASHGLSHPHSWYTPRSVGLLWTTDEADVETSTWQTQHSQQTTIRASGSIRTHNLSKLASTDLGLRKRDHWNRLYFVGTLICTLYINTYCFLIRKQRLRYLIAT